MLQNIINRLKNNFNLTPCIGVEIEFYLNNISKTDVANIEVIIGHKIKDEKGRNQFEINLPPSKDILSYIKYIELIRNKITSATDMLGGKADFSSKPYIDDYGNSMHVHLNFLEDNDIEKFARILCYYLLEEIEMFLPNGADWQRLDNNFMAPTHVCYGGNNRTVAIRIPDSLPKRLEHRVSAANANPYNVIRTILLSINKGLSTCVDTTEYTKIYGNAFDPQYNLNKI